MKTADRRPLYHFWTPNYWPAWLALGLLRLVCLLPHRARLNVGFALGRIGHRLTPSRRAITRRNIELCFPDMSTDDRDALALAHFEALGASLIEMGLGQWASDEELNSLTKIEGIEHLQKAAADGAGVIILSAHFTTLEVVGRVLRIHGPVYDGVYRKNRSPFITAFLLRGREQSARKGIEKTDIKGMVRSLREGVAVWYAADQSYTGKQSALLPFFGVPAMTNTATTTLGKLGRAVAVPFFPRRLEDGTYLLTLLPPLKGFPGDDPVVDTENFTSILEDYVRRFPAQYFWIHKKFKNRPAPLPDVYSDLDSLK